VREGRERKEVEAEKEKKEREGRERERIKVEMQNQCILTISRAPRSSILHFSQMFVCA
jgi:hypothetical protein